MKKKLSISILALLLVGVLAFGAFAYFSDTEASTGNSFTAGTLDLNIDGANTNVVKFNLDKMRPGNQPIGRYTLKNVGNISGFLDIEDVTVVNLENDLLDPEAEAGDTTASVGELGQLLNVRLFIDYNGDGWISNGDKVFYDGKVNNIPSSFNLNESITAGQELTVTAIFDWPSLPGLTDNLAQSDTLQLGLKFELAQTAGQ
jgi:predicted ribosomally synthesized peptide with SipW-like signal peptide